MLNVASVRQTIGARACRIGYGCCLELDGLSVRRRSRCGGANSNPPADHKSARRYGSAGVGRMSTRLRNQARFGNAGSSTSFEVKTIVTMTVSMYWPARERSRGRNHGEALLLIPRPAARGRIAVEPRKNTHPDDAYPSLTRAAVRPFRSPPVTMPKASRYLSPRPVGEPWREPGPVECRRTRRSTADGRPYATQVREHTEGASSSVVSWPEGVRLCSL